MHAPLYVPPAGPTYVRLDTMSRDFGAETKIEELPQFFQGNFLSRNIVQVVRLQLSGCHLVYLYNALGIFD